MILINCTMLLKQVFWVRKNYYVYIISYDAESSISIILEIELF